MSRARWASVLDGGLGEAWISRRRRVWVVVGLTLAVSLAILTRPPIPQTQSYNHFADQRTLLGVPNLLNAASNVGCIG